MATLTSTITESVFINNVNQGSTTTTTIEDVNETYKRVIEVPSTEITLYTTDPNNVGGSQFESDKLKYVRISNLDSSNAVSLIIDAGDEIGFKLHGNSSLLLTNHQSTIEGIASAGDITVTDGVAAVHRFTVTDGDGANGMTEKQSITIVDSKGISKQYVICDGNTITDGTATGDILTSTSDTGSGTAGSTYAEGIAVVLPNISSTTQNGFLIQLRNAILSANGHGSNFTVVTVGTDSNGDGVPDEANGNQSFDLTSAYKGDSGNTLPTEDVANLAIAQQTAGVDGSIAGLSTIVGVSAIAQTSTSAGAKIELFIASE